MAAAGHAHAVDRGPDLGRGPRVYERRDIERDTLHQVVRENLATFTVAIEAGFAGGTLPDFVHAELAGYLNCSVLGRRFAHLSCEKCGRTRLVAFTCGGRGFCPTCTGCRMNQTTANLLSFVLPPQPLRQWVLTLPFELRAPVAYQPGLMRRRPRLRRLPAPLVRAPPGASVPPAQGGLLTVIQRCSGDLRLAPHLRVVALDGIFVAGTNHQPVFRPLPHLKSDEVADVLQIAKSRLLKAPRPASSRPQMMPPLASPAPLRGESR